MRGPPETPPRGAPRESEAYPTGRDLRLCRILQNGASKMGANFGYARFAAVSEHPHHGRRAPHSPSTCGFPRRQYASRSRQSPQTSHSRQSRPFPDFDFARPRITERNALAGKPPGQQQELNEPERLARRRIPPPASEGQVPPRAAQGPHATAPAHAMWLLAVRHPARHRGRA